MLRFKENSKLRKEMISDITVRYEESVDHSAIYNEGTKKNIMRHLDFSLDNFLKNTLNQADYYLGKYKSLWENELKAFKGIVASAMATRLIVDAIALLRPINRRGDQVN